jgi:hypothetical protein
MPRTLISDDGSTRVWQHTDTAGHPTGTTAEVYVLPPEEANRQTLQSRAEQALATNATFLAIASPTNAQTLAQVRALTRETTALIRLLLDKTGDTAGT